MSDVTVSKSVLVYRRRRANFIAERGNACEKCGSRDRLEIDHIKRSDKLMSPSDAFQRRAEIRTAELAKCQVLCYACHLTKTIAEQASRNAHGTHDMYVRGCRCRGCKDAHAAKAREYRSRKKSF